MEEHELQVLKLVSGEEIISFVSYATYTDEESFEEYIRIELVHPMKINIFQNNGKTIVGLSPWVMMANKQEHELPPEHVMAYDDPIEQLASQYLAQFQDGDGTEEPAPVSQSLESAAKDTPVELDLEKVNYMPNHTKMH